MSDTRYQLEGKAPQLFERDGVPTVGRPLAELVFEHVPPHDGDWVLDAVCGTGIVARLAALRVGASGQVVGLDLNPRMLQVARANTPTIGAPVEWWQGDVCALPFPDAHFDVVFCQNGLQYAPDRLAALRDMRRVLVPGGRLALSVWSAVPPYHAALAESLARHVSAEAATRCLSPYSLRDAEIIKNLVGDAEFHAIDMQVLGIRVRRPSSAESVLADLARSPYGRAVAAVSEETRSAIGEEVCAAMQAYRDGNDFVIPQEIHLVQAWAGGFWTRLWGHATAAWAKEGCSGFWPLMPTRGD